MRRAPCSAVQRKPFLTSHCFIEILNFKSLWKLTLWCDGALFLNLYIDFIFMKKSIFVNFLFCFSSFLIGLCLIGEENLIIRGIMFVFCGVIPFCFMINIFYLSFYRNTFSALIKILLLVFEAVTAGVIGIICLFLLAKVDLIMIQIFGE